MKLNFRILILLTFFHLTNLSAQESIPVLTGKVEISISKGTFVCDLTLSEIPQIKDYFIRLNSGMNILYMKSKKTNNFLLNYSKSLNDSLSTGEVMHIIFQIIQEKKNSFQILFNLSM